ncbi:ammonium transporter [Solidesulfovibrio carbinoliphilus subsp. oakridgensis]|uniref:Ammonium transporter n=1 Tax=Solidesulfovibrio carbinoliphilus subsp. oakridgensis TaxID=694327 RepID=G7QBA2_9BACT|nr:ammonium transporter [Solidesulfovibrio carbinoliphilus]EHJ49325.1 ammonium transporter [Solidesulfovibrio carbinoliphilus subsp. oakridgensis]
MNAADTAFVLISAALVMLMTPGLALFYGGMVRGKNILGTLMHSNILLGTVTVLWAIVGYSLAFGGDIGGLIGNLDFVFLKGVGTAAKEGIDNIPHLAFMIFQCMFAVITPALITGAFAERIKFSGFLLFTSLWLVLVYCPMAHWVWGGGWMAKMGALDFAGGAVVHMSSGASALAAVLYLGRRHGYGKQSFIPHNLPLTILGAGLLWFGWFGFNAGSALAANGLAASAFVTTHLAAAAAAVSWIVVEWMHRGKPTTLGMASGAVAGLVAITPAAGYVEPMPAILIGLVAGGLCYGGVLVKSVFKYDDALDVVGIHGLGGTFGALATGLFATKAVNELGADGLFYGNPGQLWIQFVSVAATWAFCFVMTLILFKVVDLMVGIRVSQEDEIKGLDVSQHSEVGYQL